MAGNLFDAYTTDKALERGGMEANPVLKGIAGNDAALYSTKLALGLTQAYVVHLLDKGDHKKAAKILSMITFGIPTGIGIRNMGVQKK